MMVFFLFLLVTFNLSAAELTWLRPESVDLSKIAPPPATGTVQDKEDLATVLEWQRQRTEEDCRQASQEAEAFATSYFGPPKGPLTEDEARALIAFQEKLFAEAKFFTRILKTKYGRQRPYLRSSEIKPCISLERSLAYPSGHSTLAVLAARTFSLLYPEREVSFLVRADQISFNRVVGGVHHPSDVIAGKLLGEIIFLELLKGESFRRDVEAQRP